METTANGLNQFHSLWVDDNNGFDKTFLSWTDEPEYIYKGIIEIPQIIEEYGKEHGLTKFQLKWAAQTLAVKCANSFITFQQEYAIDPITCFVSSGTRFFNDVYPDAKWSLGYREYAEKKNYGVYVLGADTASGSPTGDYSAFCVIDVFNNSQPTIVATYAGYNTPIEFGRMVLAECKKWNATAVVESNSYGLAVVEVLVEAEWGKIYTNQRFDDMTRTYTTKLGFNTNAVSRGMLLSNLQEIVNSKNIAIIDDRIQYQANTFCYDANGRPDHMRGCHDDLLFSLGLALMGIDQAMVEIYSEQRTTPQSVREIVEMELKTGLPVSILQKQGYFAEADEETFHIPWA